MDPDYAYLIDKGVSPELARRWLETCYPAQIRLVLTHPDWAEYPADELAHMGINGVRGLRPEVRKRRKELKQQEQRALISQNIRLREERERNKTVKSREAQKQAAQDVLDEFW